MRVLTGFALKQLWQREANSVLQDGIEAFRKDIARFREVWNSIDIRVICTHTPGIWTNLACRILLTDGTESIPDVQAITLTSDSLALFTQRTDFAELDRILHSLSSGLLMINDVKVCCGTVHDDQCTGGYMLHPTFGRSVRRMTGYPGERFSFILNGTGSNSVQDLLGYHVCQRIDSYLKAQPTPYDGLDDLARSSLGLDDLSPTHLTILWMAAPINVGLTDECGLRAGVATFSAIAGPLIDLERVRLGAIATYEVPEPEGRFPIALEASDWKHTGTMFSASKSIELPHVKGLKIYLTYKGHEVETRELEARASLPMHTLGVDTVGEMSAGPKHLLSGNWLVLQENFREGGQSVIHLAENRKTGRKVAIKVIKSRNPKNIERFKKEIESLKQLKHKNIVTILGHNLDEFVTGKTDENPYYVLEYAEKGTLADQEYLQGELEPSLKIFRDICNGAAAAHEKGVIHRDLKPENILFIDDVKTPKIADFGICYLQEVQAEERLTSYDEKVGSRFFVAPEQEMGRNLAVDERADIFSLGKILFYMLTGRVFEGDRLDNLADRFNDSRFALIDTLLKEHMVVDEKEKRYASVEQVIEHVDKILSVIRGDTEKTVTEALLSVATAGPETSANEMSRHREKFDSQFDESLKAFELKNPYKDKGYSGYREVAFFPGQFIPHKARISELRSAIPTAAESRLGFPLLRFTAAQLKFYAIQDGIESVLVAQGIDGVDLLKFWRLYRSGFFYHRELMEEESVQSSNDDTPIMYLELTFNYILEAISCAIRLYEALRIQDGPLTIRFKLLGTEGRRLKLLDRGRFPLVGGYRCRIPEVIEEHSLSLTEWRTGLLDKSTEIMDNICHMFNWDKPYIDFLGKGVERLLDQQP